METKQFRQGDVLIERVNRMPDGGEIVPNEGGRVILAHGEVTGHAHAILGTEGRMFDTGGSRFLQVDGPKSPDVARPVRVTHEEHAPILLEPGTYEVIYQREYHPAEIRRVLD